MFVFSGDVYVTIQMTFLSGKTALIYTTVIRQSVASLTLGCNDVFADLRVRNVICIVT